MAWIKASDLMPQENEQVLIHENVHERIELGRYADGKWYVEDLQTGELNEIAGVTHWAPLLDSELNDESEDD